MGDRRELKHTILAALVASGMPEEDAKAALASYVVLTMDQLTIEANQRKGYPWD